MQEEFCLKVWPSKRRRRVEIYNRWKFRGPAKGNVDGLLLAISENKVVGQLGLIPVKIKYGTEIYDAQWSCDFMVDPDFRNSGIGSKLFAEAKSRDMITLGHHPTPFSEKVLRKSGLRPIPSGRIMVFPVKAEYILEWVIPKKFNFLIPIAKTVVQPYFSLKINKMLKEESTFEICKWEEVTDLIKQRQDENSDPQILHDKEFLKWRADGLEKFSPVISAAKSGNGSYALHSPFSPNYDVYEWQCKKPEDIRGLLALITNLTLENKSQFMRVMANDEKEEKRLKEFGFVRSRNIESVFQYSKNNLLSKAEKFYFTLYDTDFNL